MIPYPELLARLRLTGYPPSLVAQHARTGLTAGQTCGSCSAFGEIWLHSQGPQPYCHVVRAFEKWRDYWPACGKWKAKNG